MVFLKKAGLKAQPFVCKLSPLVGLIARGLAYSSPIFFLPEAPFMVPAGIAILSWYAKPRSIGVFKSTDTSLGYREHRMV